MEEAPVALLGEAGGILSLVSKCPILIRKANFPLNLEVAKNSRIPFLEFGNLLHLKRISNNNNNKKIQPIHLISYCD